MVSWSSFYILLYNPDSIVNLKHFFFQLCDINTANLIALIHLSLNKYSIGLDRQQETVLYTFKAALFVRWYMVSVS